MSPSWSHSLCQFHCSFSPFRPERAAGVVTCKVVKSLTGSTPLHPTPATHMEAASAVSRGSPVRYEHRGVSQPIWGPWSHVSTRIALLATSPGHIGDRKEVAEQKHSRCSSSVGHRGSLLPQHLAHSAAERSEAERDAPPQSGELPG